MRYVSLLLFGLLSMNSHAEIMDEWVPQISLQSSEKDSNLKSDQSKFVFNFMPLDGSVELMRYSIDGIEGTQEISEGQIEILSEPGMHKFQFYYTSDYQEVYSDSLLIQGGYTNTYDVQMYSAYIQIMVDKPVIYLYPTAETEVTLKLAIKGKPSFYYPSYSDEWKFTADPSGNLKFGEAEYRYLFWEAQQSRTFTKDELKTGFVVQKSEVIDFLEEKLTLAGLNTKEQADFITYWGPRLSQNAYNFVHFEFNEECNRYAELGVEPKPDNSYRIYIAWMPVSENFKCEEQSIQSANRTGFTLIEWGGCEVKQVLKKSNKAIK